MSILQHGWAPYTMTCLGCGKRWNPEPSRSGPAKGVVTDASLDREARAHWYICPGGLEVAEMERLRRIHIHEPWDGKPG